MNYKIFQNPSLLITFINLVICFLLPLFHILLERLYLTNKNNSPQLCLLSLIIVMNLILICAITMLNNFLRPVDYGFLYSLILFNSYSYSYFHFFNLSETGRRIKILQLIEENNGCTNGPGCNYSPEEMVELRLKRLTQMSQIQANCKEQYVVVGKTLLFVGKILRITSFLIVGKNRIGKTTDL
jgi:hypothetical protein